MKSFDVIVIGAGVIGSSVAFHLAELGAKNVLVLDRATIGAGTTSQSSGILRTHYSVRENVELARRSWGVFNDFANYLGDDEASCGLVKCGYLISAADDAKLEPLRGALAQQVQQGIALELLNPAQARELLPIASFDDAALIGFEPEAGFADAYLVATSFARGARRRGVTVRENVDVRALLVESGRVRGVSTSEGDYASPLVISTQNIWTAELAGWTGLSMPVAPERHAVLALECAQAPYTYSMPVYKDLASPGMLYCRSYGGNQMLVSEGIVGEALQQSDAEQGDIPLDYVAEVGAQVAERFPAYETAGLASSWTGVYDVTPDWNPVLGRVGGLEGLIVGFGFSGHGFKLSPTVGRVLAQEALGLPTDVPLAPYDLGRFQRGALLTGKYGLGAVS
ncbi:FAD-binding oxidoreductase [Achromobacter denitrificans]|uniref:NAD(P)/FAD-dependent oxidoreductase n=1 Tax=Achromobacter denitrificans TaxID=32002 RepID=UPI000F4F01AF|nr:FAD-binding oxidoreductase [Achromobacter denitrificans]MBV2159188.1 FAD-binding oxidoreductase [Achromobacter denitrificans]MDX3878445.1 FAD-binding oxidoreductase [Achromobacter sp.]QCS66510.1 FAD-binding oxidoreductase [Achromobacter denitrificans]WFC66025.1 FAD-binding oxidoreductase [Achromobacter denitrificans]